MPVLVSARLRPGKRMHMRSRRAYRAAPDRIRAPTGSAYRSTDCPAQAPGQISHGAVALRVSRRSYGLLHTGLVEELIRRGEFGQPVQSEMHLDKCRTMVAIDSARSSPQEVVRVDEICEGEVGRRLETTIGAVIVDPSRNRTPVTYHGRQGSPRLWCGIGARRRGRRIARADVR